MIDKPVRRMTLRELMTHAEKCTRDLVENIHGSYLPNAADYRDLTRPVRRRSHYPTLIAIQNALDKWEEGVRETVALCEYLLEQMESIRESARREVMTRV